MIDTAYVGGGAFPMKTARQVAKAFAELPPDERRKAIELVPEMLSRDEAFIIRRRKQARRDLLAGKTVPATQAILEAQTRRRSQ
jgi:hypothetical protein